MTLLKSKIFFDILFSSLTIIFFPFLIFGQDTIKHNKKTHLLAFPVIARSIETSWSFGAAGTSTYRLNNDTTTRTSNMQAIAIYSLKKQLVVALNNTVYFPHESYILTNQFSYSSFPDKFWGIGPYSKETDVESYSFNQFYAFAHLQKKTGNHFFVGGMYSYQNLMKVEYLAGGLFDNQQVAGRTPYHISGLGVSFTYDDRNNAFAPDNGSLYQIFLSHYDKSFGSTFNFNSITVDTRKYWKIYKQQVLAVQAFGLFNTGNEVPIRSLSALGGSYSMRGFYQGRYIDRNMMVLQSEYRIPVYKLLGLAVFGSTGEVGHTLNEFSLENLKLSYGIGARIALSKKEKMNLRLDYGFTQHNSGFYLQVGEAF